MKQFYKLALVLLIAISGCASTGQKNDGGSTRPLRDVEAVRLLENSRNYYALLPSWSASVSGSSLWVEGATGRTYSEHLPESIYSIRKPNQFSIRYVEPGRSETLVCNGETIWIYSNSPELSDQGRYSESRAQPGFESLHHPSSILLSGYDRSVMSQLTADYFDFMLSDEHDIMLLKPLEDENDVSKIKIRNDQSGVEVALTLKNGLRPWLLESRLSHEDWLETEMAAGRQLPANPMRGTWTVKFENWSEEVPPNQFEFIPPHSARKMDNIYSDLLAQAAKVIASGGMFKSSLAGKPAPAAIVRTLEGADRTLEDLRAGGVLVIDFWATWCGPCIQSLPKTAGVAQEFADRGVRFIALDVGESEAAVRKLVAKRNFSMPIALDEKGVAAKAFGVTAMPTSVIIDQEGVIREVTIGAIPDLDAKLRAKLDELTTPKQDR